MLVKVYKIIDLRCCSKNNLDRKVSVLDIQMLCGKKGIVMIVLFRTLIIVSNLAFIIWFFQPYYSSSLYTDELRDLLQADGYTGVDILLRYSVETGYAFLALYLISAVGMLLYMKSARTLFAILCLLSLITPLFYGMSVQSNIDEVLNNISYMGDSIVLYMSYFSTVARKFKNT